LKTQQQTTNKQQLETKMTTKTMTSACVALTMMGVIAKADWPNPPDALYKELAAKKFVIKPVEGGSGGNNVYHGYLATGEHFTKITVYTGKVVDGIELETSAGQRMLLGHTGIHPESENANVVNLKEGQRLISVVIKHGEWKRGGFQGGTHNVITGISLVFKNADGTLDSKQFGQIPDKTMAADSGYEISGLWGWSGAVLDSIGIIERP
jgi:hypothetical protein